MSYTTTDVLLKRCQLLLDEVESNGEDFPTYMSLKADLVREIGKREFDEVKDKVQDMLLKKCALLRGRDTHVEVVLLFDVDETLVIAENSLTPYRYNEELMNAWRKCLNCLNSVRCCSFLFTSQQLCTPAFVYRPADEPTSEPSRVRLRMHLRDKFRIRVPAVVTTYDYIYDSDFALKIGAYYRDNIEQFERKIQTGASIQFDDPALLSKQKAEKQLHGKKQEIVRRLKQKLEGGNKDEEEDKEFSTKKDDNVKPPMPPPSTKFMTRDENDMIVEGPKALMIRYVIGHLMKHGFLRSKRRTKIMLFDDRQDVLKCVSSVISLKEYSSIEFMGVQVNHERDESYYASQFFSYLQNEFFQYPRLRRLAQLLENEVVGSHGPLWRRRHRCFSGNNAIQWMMKNGHAVSESAAIATAQAMLDSELFFAVEEKDRSQTDFNPGKRLYQVKKSVFRTVSL